MSTHPFDDALELEQLGDGRFRGRTTAPYNNMVGPFGGVTAATLVRAIALHPDRLGDPVSLTVNFAGPVAEAVRTAWRQLDVVQCGYCQSGQIMSATALLKATPKPSDSDIDNAMSGNICRCGTYGRIRHAIKIAAAK